MPCERLKLLDRLKEAFKCREPSCSVLFGRCITSSCHCLACAAAVVKRCNLKIQLLNQLWTLRCVECTRRLKSKDDGSKSETEPMLRMT